MKRLIISGGGDEKDSKILDKLLISLIPKNKKILYIPIAWKGGRFDECYKWFSSTFLVLKFTNFEMWTNLEGREYEDLEGFGAIYIGGGNTFLLLNEFRRTGFMKILKRFINSGRVVYGGSAGAIILGKSIETASFGKEYDRNKVKIKDLKGLNLVGDYIIQCHYEEDQDEELLKFVNDKKLPVIAIPERSGLFIEGKRIKVIGFKSSYVFENGKKFTVNPNNYIS